MLAPGAITVPVLAMCCAEQRRGGARCLPARATGLVGGRDLGAQHGRQRGVLQHGAPQARRVEGARRSVHKRGDAQSGGLGRVRRFVKQLALPAGCLRCAAQIEPALPQPAAASLAAPKLHMNVHLSLGRL